MAVQCLNHLNGSLLLLLATAVLMLYSLALKVSAVTCYEGVGRTQVSNNNTIKLRAGELLIVHCIANRDEYQALTLSTCEIPHNLPVQTMEDQFTLNITWFCHVTSNTSWTMEISGFTADIGGHVNLYELDIEAYDLEQCLEPDVRTTPSPCTTPSSMTEPATTTSTNPTTSTTETITTETPTTTISTTISTTAITTNLETTDPADTTDPLTSTDPTNINNLDKIRMNNATSEEVKEHTLYGGLCLLGVTVIVQFLVIVLLAVKLCQRKRREKVVVEEGEAVSDRQQELRKINRQNSDRDNETVISNRSSIDMETTADSSIPKTEI